MPDQPLEGDPSSEGLYARLGVPRDATQGEIRHAYRQLIRRFTPEHSPDEFARIREAWETLGDPARRAAYDAAPSPVALAAMRRGAHARRHHDHRAAVGHFREALAAEPGFLDAVRFLALSHLDLGEGDQALVHLETLRARGDDSPTLKALLAQAQGLRGFWSEAEAHYREAIARGRELGEDVDPLLLGLSEALAAQGRKAEARKVLEDALVGVPFNRAVPFLVRLSWLGLTTRGIWAFKPYLKRLDQLSADPAERAAIARSLAGWARQLAQSGHYHPAEKVAELVARLDPTVPMYASLRTYCALRRRGDAPGARKLVAADPAFAHGAYLHALANVPMSGSTELPKASSWFEDSNHPWFLVAALAFVGVVWLVGDWDPGCDGTPERLDHGAVLIRSGSRGTAALHLTNHTGRDAVILLVRGKGETSVAVHLQSDQSLVVDSLVPGPYRLRYAIGEGWVAGHEGFCASANFGKRRRAVNVGTGDSAEIVVRWRSNVPSGYDAGLRMGFARAYRAAQP